MYNQLRELEDIGEDRTKKSRGHKKHTNVTNFISVKQFQHMRRESTKLRAEEQLEVIRQKLERKAENPLNEKTCFNISHIMNEETVAVKKYIYKKLSRYGWAVEIDENKRGHTTYKLVMAEKKTLE